MKRLIGIATLLALLIAGCTGSPDPTLTSYSRSNIVMGTMLEVTVYRPSTEAKTAAGDLDAAFSVIQGIDQSMSLYKEDSELVGLNQSAGSGSVSVSSPLFDILSASDFYASLSDAAFDVTIQPLVALWGFYDVRTAQVPTQSAIDTVLQRIGPHHMTRENADVALDAGSAIDLGGIAKGYAIDLALATLAKRGVTSALINLGGTVGVLGLPPGDRPWVAGVKHPRGDRLIGQIEFTSGAVSTSGDYDRYFEADGKRYSHLLDPRTGWPVDHLFALTVHAPTATAADALSTAAFILGPEDGLALLDGCAGVSGLVAAPGEQDAISVTIIGEDTSARFVLDPSEDAATRARQSGEPKRVCVYQAAGFQKE